MNDNDIAINNKVDADFRMASAATREVCGGEVAHAELVAIYLDHLRQERAFAVNAELQGQMLQMQGQRR